MSESINEALERLCASLRRGGVAKYAGPFDRFDRIELELHPAQPTDAKPEKAVDTEKCACGHPYYEHSHGGCLAGCEPDKCAGQQQEQPS